MSNTEIRHNVPLTEKEINALIIQINQVRIVDVHASRICAVRDGLEELKSVQSGIRIAGGG